MNRRKTSIEQHIIKDLKLLLKKGPLNIRLQGPATKTDKLMHAMAVATSTNRKLTTFKMTKRIGDVSIYQLLP